MLPPEAGTYINRFQSLCDNEKRGSEGVGGGGGYFIQPIVRIICTSQLHSASFIPNPLRPQKYAGMADAVSRVGSTRKTASSLATHFLVSTGNCVIHANARFGLHGKLRHPWQSIILSTRETASSMPTHFLVSTENCVIHASTLFGLHGKLRHPCQRTFWSTRKTSSSMPTNVLVST